MVEPRRVNDDPTGNKLRQHVPHMAVAPNGRIDVVWLDRRTINLDMGVIPGVGSYSWLGPVAAPLGNDAVLFAWSDPRDGNIDTDTNDV